MISLKIMGIGLLTLSMFFVMAAVIPSLGQSFVGISNVFATSENGDKECMSTSSALFFDNRIIETSSV